MISNDLISVIMPVYNVEAYIAEAITSVLEQKHDNLELIIVDDGGNDASMAIARSFDDARIRIVSQANRGLAGARNTGIAHARGELIALLDSDDRWHCEKLRMHAIHLHANPDVAVSYSGSALMDQNGEMISVAMRPKLTGVTPADILKRNPVGNGSAPVIRKAALDLVQFAHPDDASRSCWFDESFRQSEDIELWLRMSAGYGCKFEGIEGLLTEYRIVGGGLSANIVRQFESWQRAVGNAQSYAPQLLAKYEEAAAAYQLRYLARRAIQLGDYAFARSLAWQAVSRHPLMLLQEPAKSLVTTVAALIGPMVPRTFMTWISRRKLGAAGAA